MIWQSTMAMTIIDLLLIVIACFALWSLYALRASRSKTDSGPGSIMIVSGVAFFGALYSFDLFAMYGLPSIMSPEIAMAVMKELHLEFSWIVSLAGIGLIVTGHLLNNKKLTSLIGRLESIQNDLIEENKQRGKNQEELERRVQERAQKLQSTVAVLSESEAHLNILNSFSPVALIRFDPDGRVS
jgi:hypothetical protein